MALLRVEVPDAVGYTPLSSVWEGSDGELPHYQASHLGSWYNNNSYPVNRPPRS